MATHLVNSGGKLFCGLSGDRSFAESPSTGTPAPSTAINNGDLSIDQSLLFDQKQIKNPVLTEDQVATIIKRIAEMDDEGIRRSLAEVEGQRWRLPPDPKTEMSYRFYALANILDLIPEIKEEQA